MDPPFDPPLSALLRQAFRSPGRNISTIQHRMARGSALLRERVYLRCFVTLVIPRCRKSLFLHRRKYSTERLEMQEVAISFISKRFNAFLLSSPCTDCST